MRGQGRPVNQRTSKWLNRSGRFQPRELHTHLVIETAMDGVTRAGRFVTVKQGNADHSATRCGGLAMEDRDRCRDCGEKVPADAPGELCPACRLRADMAGGAPANGDHDWHGVPDARAEGASPPSLPATSAPSALARLAETLTLTDIPHVHLRDTEPLTVPGPAARPSSAQMSDPADRLARLELLGEVARGGMGVIIRGRDSDLGRDLAVKVLLEQHREKPDLIRRFVEEAQISGQLQHPGVVPVYELGTLADHRPYFAMKLVKGRTLAALLAERTATPSLLPLGEGARRADEGSGASSTGEKVPAGRMRGRGEQHRGEGALRADEGLPRFLAIFEAVCQTMAYAHARGVIHRDLKPLNIMVGSFGEVQVMDWGLAKVLPQGGLAGDDKQAGSIRHETVIQTGRTGAGTGSDAELSQAGSVMGTPAYMPPEQASGDIDRLDERADVFALGSILCEILTGQPAFTGRTVREIHRKATRGDLADAFGRLDACGADAELAGLARACLACEPEDRPRNAGAVAEQLASYLAGVQERLRAAELARVEAQARAEEEGKRRRLQVSLAASILALTTVGGLAAAAYLHQRQARAAQVELALNETTLLRKEALKAPDDLSRWQAAQEAIKRVEVALGDDGNAQARHRLGDLRREVESGVAAARRDRELLDALAEIRSDHLGRKPGVTDMAYAEAFRRAGIDLDTLTPAEAAAQLRARPASVVVRVLPYLDSWSLVRRNDEQARERWQRPLAVARAADSDSDRNRLRAQVERPDIRKQGAALRDLAHDRQVAELPPTSILQLASALREAGEPAEAISLLESAAQRYPDDVWINYNLAEVLAGFPTRREEAVRYYTAARALRPETAHNLGHLLDQMGRGDDAIATFRALVKVRPAEPRNIGCLATVLLGRHQREEGLKTLDQAIAAARETIRHRPGDAGEHYILGLLLAIRGDPDGAIAADREALRIQPGHSGALANLVTLLSKRGDQDGIIAVFRAAIRARPDHAWSHEALSAALQAKGDPDGAIAEIREAIRLNPEEQAYRTQLSALLKSRGNSTTPSP
jgi:serine/threonine-protein kinase